MERTVNVKRMNNFIKLFLVIGIVAIIAIVVNLFLLSSLQFENTLSARLAQELRLEKEKQESANFAMGEYVTEGAIK